MMNNIVPRSRTDTSAFSTVDTWAENALRVMTSSSVLRVIREFSLPPILPSSWSVLIQPSPVLSLPDTFECIRCFGPGAACPK